MSSVFDAFDVREALVSLEKIREVLVIGLGCYGELERLSNAQGIEKLCGRELPDNLRVIHPAPHPEAVADFAAALDYIDLVMHQIRDGAKAAQALEPGQPNRARAPEEPETLPSSR
jgi:hypothetical protein